MIAVEPEGLVELRQAASAIPPTVIPPWIVYSHRLVSWWDMERFSAEKYFGIATVIELLRAKYNEDKIVSKDASFASGVYSLENAERQSLSHDFQVIADKCSAIGLRIASGTAADVQKWLIKASEITNVYVVSEIRNIQRTIVLEMRDNLFLYIPSDRSKKYLEPLAGWQEVVDKLPQVVSDIKEANICFACGLYAGAVFHTTLVLEAGVVQLGRLLQINDPKMGWNSVTREVARIIKANYKTLNVVEQQHFSLVQQLDPLIESMKNSWRHKITHAENKLVLLTGEFNDRTAEEIMIASRAFMRRLVAEL